MPVIAAVGALGTLLVGGGTAAAGAVLAGTAAATFGAVVVGGMAIGAVAGGIIAAVRGGNILKGILVGAGIGAVAGAGLYGGAAAGLWGNGANAAVTGTEATGMLGSAAPAAAPTGAAPTGATGLIAPTGPSLGGTELAAQVGGGFVPEAATTAGNVGANVVAPGLTAGEKLLAGSSLVTGLGNAYSSQAEADAEEKAQQELARLKEQEYQRTRIYNTPGMQAATGAEDLSSPDYVYNQATNPAQPPAPLLATQIAANPPTSQQTMFQRLSNPGELSKPLTIQQQPAGLIPA